MFFCYFFFNDLVYKNVTLEALKGNYSMGGNYSINTNGSKELSESEKIQMAMESTCNNTENCLYVKISNQETFKGVFNIGFNFSSISNRKRIDQRGGNWSIDVVFRCERNLNFIF
jgi:hypothetical protein